MDQILLVSDNRAGIDARSRRGCVASATMTPEQERKGKTVMREHDALPLLDGQGIETDAGAVAAAGTAVTVGGFRGGGR